MLCQQADLRPDAGGVCCNLLRHKVHAFRLLDLTFLGIITGCAVVPGCVDSLFRGYRGQKGAGGLALCCAAVRRGISHAHVDRILSDLLWLQQAITLQL